MVGAQLARGESQQMFLRRMCREWGLIQGDGHSRVVLVIPANISEEDAQGIGFELL